MVSSHLSAWHETMIGLATFGLSGSAHTFFCVAIHRSTEVMIPRFNSLFLMASYGSVEKVGVTRVQLQSISFHVC
jgi:hypothetical protein